MRTIIAGSRTINDYKAVEDAVAESGFSITSVLSGRAGGVDSIGELWANSRGIPVDLHPANWSRYGKSAGRMRNQVMVDNADCLIAVWDGKSTGTADVIKRAKAAGLQVFVKLIERPAGDTMGAAEVA